MRGLIGYTGFVGSNLLNKLKFDRLYNSKNISEIKGESFELLICAGAPAVKWKANKFPDEDLSNIQFLINNLEEVTCKEFVLISTVDVYKKPTKVYESTKIDVDSLEPYGRHRLLLERFVRQHFPKVRIIRLPGLFGQGLKKNIIYDFIHNNCVEMINSENIFQFYNLDRLSRDLDIVMKNNVSLINFATEPMSVKEVAKYALNLEFTQTVGNSPVSYDMRTEHASLFNQKTDYIASKEEVLDDIRKFVQNEIISKEIKQ
ncbi:NAD(P)-dependent oxidoreductase [Neobacillus sp. OS1-2]|uniref:NAD(P)-dependent oxidoreductase n=1 Tax=Neobacillus sp. OS1-2 TaxID=3070680 RepID=UPI0027DFC706|nr:NAD(P)-dependent oxidoreductase [Neobacillus sp. OS1-2]WML41237.1 NAD(P)-dependent oxidoreductase [Neobacillus sp. OS1-2]